MADPGRMTLEEREQAHTLLTRALTDPNWRTASQALDDLMRKLLVVHRPALDLLPALLQPARQRAGEVPRHPVVAERGDHAGIQE